MAHSLPLDRVREHLFILENLAYAADEYASRHKLVKAVDVFEYPDLYFPTLLDHISRMLLDVATNFRVLYDLASEDCSEGYSPLDTDRNVSARSLVSEATISDSPVTVREICNKIIHARRITIPRIAGSLEGTEKWNGYVKMTGVKRKHEWTCEFALAAFASSTEDLIGHLEENIDWWNLYEDPEVKPEEA